MSKSLRPCPFCKDEHLLRAGYPVGGDAANTGLWVATITCSRCGAVGPAGAGATHREAELSAGAKWGWTPKKGRDEH